VVSLDFFFALAVSGGASREMLDDLVARVLERAGSSGDGVAALGEALHAALANAPRDQLIDVRFSAGAGQLRIVVSSPAGDIWQTSRDIP
jgi:hypothetical protein